ncbi:putative pterin-binding protein, partial [Serratia marcescens]|uniref:molybdopterin-dependent oxidoreductase n=1 Tax=Serratia marcescens TaxID=615 RepID=UPI000A56AF9E
HGTVCVVGKMRDLILQLSKSSIYSTKPFEGVKFKDLLKLVGARGKTLRMRALNDYWVDIPVSDIEQFDILLANKMDGNPLKVRDFGPYFVIYPMDKFYDKLNSPTFQARHIWQVSGITVLEK